MLSITIFLPLLGIPFLWFIPAARVAWARNVAVLLGGAVMVLTVVLALRFDPGGGFQFAQNVPWIPSLGVGYRVALDGLSLPLFALTALLFAVVTLFSWEQSHRPREFFAWFLFLETACLGLFAARDLFLFYVFWDLSLVAMYFIIVIWGHTDARAAALKFFLYTIAGSMALLLGIIGLYLAASPNTMDMALLAEQQVFAGGGWIAQLVFFALLIGFAIKTPTVPVHTWLPPAHAEAPAAGSAILAGVLLKMGTYGFVRILLDMLPQAFHQYAPLVIALGLVGVIYGALVALAQTDLKRLIAYTSVNHMGYVVLAVGAAALITDGGDDLRQLLLNGAVLQMVSHGLITGALFLLAGIVWKRAHTFDMDSLGGIAHHAPVLTVATGVAVFASLGLPGLSGFVAEFQIFAGAFGVVPWVAAAALLGVVITAGLLLWMMQRVFLGKPAEVWPPRADMQWYERVAVFGLLFWVVLIGLLPAWLIQWMNGANAAIARAGAA